MLVFFLVAVLFFLAAVFILVRTFPEQSSPSLVQVYWLLYSSFFSVAAFLFGAAAFFSDIMRVFFNYGDILYKFLIRMNSPEATLAFNLDRKVEFNHFLSFRRSACMISFIVVMDEPV